MRQTSVTIQAVRPGLMTAESLTRESLAVVLETSAEFPVKPEIETSVKASVEPSQIVRSVLGSEHAEGVIEIFVLAEIYGTERSSVGREMRRSVTTEFDRQVAFLSVLIVLLLPVFADSLVRTRRPGEVVQLVVSVEEGEICVESQVEIDVPAETVEVVVVEVAGIVVRFVERDIGEVGRQRFRLSFPLILAGVLCEVLLERPVKGTL